MSRASDALARGFDVLTSVAGDTVSFRGASLPAVIDRTPIVQNDPDLTVNFASRGYTVIELRALDIATLTDKTAPRVGEFVTEGAIRHRIETVYPRQDSYVLHCPVTQ